MSDIKQRIQAIKPYFREMQVVPDNGTSIVYVVVKFPDRWIIADDIEKKFEVTVARDNIDQNKYFFCAEIESGFDVVFDAIDYNVNKMKSAQERAMLLQKKVSELRELFENEDISLDTLRSIDFSQYSIIHTKQFEKQTVVEKVEEDTIKSTDNVDDGDSIISKLTGKKKKNKNETEHKEE